MSNSTAITLRHNSAKTRNAEEFGYRTIVAVTAQFTSRKGRTIIPKSLFGAQPARPKLLLPIDDTDGLMLSRATIGIARKNISIRVTPKAFAMAKGTKPPAGDGARIVVQTFHTPRAVGGAEGR